MADTCLLLDMINLRDYLILNTCRQLIAGWKPGGGGGGGWGAERGPRVLFLPLPTSAGRRLNLEGLQVNGELGEVSPRRPPSLRRRDGRAAGSAASSHRRGPGALRRGRASFTSSYLPVKDAPAKSIVKLPEFPAAGGWGGGWGDKK